MTEANFSSYVLFRVLDSLGSPGSYRRFLSIKKDQSNSFAVDMFNHVQAVQAALQELEAKQQELRTSPLHPMMNLLQHVAESNLPPSDLSLEIGSCIISGKVDVPCVVIKGKGRGSLPFHVSSRTVPFLVDVWQISKLDLLIKVFAKGVVETIDPHGQLPLAEVVAEIERTRGDDMRALAGAFYDSYQHVFRSITTALQAIV